MNSSGPAAAAPPNGPVPARNATRRNNRAASVAGGEGLAAGGAGNAGAAASPAAANAPHRSLIARIQSNIESLPGSYRFLYTEPMSLDSPYYFLGLNPGGKADDPTDLFIEHGNAFLNENWGKGGGKNDLQNQLMILFQNIANKVAGELDWQNYMSKRWCISNVIFYRSPRWADLDMKKERVSKCGEVWAELFTRNPPKIVITNGDDTHTVFMKLITKLGWVVTKNTEHGGAWDGPDLIECSKEDAKMLVVAFAHLSTFKVMTSKSRPATLEWLEEVYKEMRKYH